MVELFIEQASTYAAQIDGLILLIAVIVGFWFILAEFALIGLVIKFRHKEGRKAQYITGKKKSEKRWVTIPHLIVLVCDVVIIVGAIIVWVNVKQTLPPAESTVRIIGQQWAWTFQHPGEDGALDTADDIFTVDELHIEPDKVYHYKLVAKDVVHSFSVPVFRLKQDAIPGREITGWFEATKTGEFDIQCAEMCGIGHGMMAARLFIESPEDHAAWMATQRATAQR
jgi:cytochrome c oxidase subunit 2